MQAAPSSLGWFDIVHLQHTRLWLTIGGLMVILVAVLSMLPLSSGMARLMVNDKLLHLLAYAGLMGWFVQLYRHDLARLLLALLFITMGILIEYIQDALRFRQFDHIDMLANGSGVLLAWALAHTQLGQVLEGVERLWANAGQRG